MAEPLDEVDRHLRLGAGAVLVFVGTVLGMLAGWPVAGGVVVLAGGALVVSGHTGLPLGDLAARAIDVANVRG